MADINNIEPLAIVGMGCRFPGGVYDAESYWKMLCAGTDTTSELPDSRWNRQNYSDDDASVQGKMRTHRGAFLDDIEGFDSEFFGISPREAMAMDPQQRLLLEVTWEAIENAGIVPGSLAGTHAGVYMGAFALDYKLLQLDYAGRSLIGPHTSTGVAATLVANRISYWFDLRGASVTLDTACSSSLVALHMACQDIWSGRASLALAGGVNVIFKPEWTLAADKGGYLSPDGRCKAFDASADGYGRGEGVGVVVLKPLADAIRDHDRVYAAVCGTAVNQDGHSNGITVPRVESQIDVMKAACELGGVLPEQVQYVEAHGTGTPVGDPVEAEAIGSVFSSDKRESPCLMGSVKTQIGHLEAAAGVAGLMKAALTLYYKKIPANLHFNTPNPAINFEGLGLHVVSQYMDFPDGDLSYAGVNSFGFGGTNAHAVLKRIDPAVSGYRG